MLLGLGGREVGVLSMWVTVSPRDSVQGGTVGYCEAWLPRHSDRLCLTDIYLPVSLEEAEDMTIPYYVPLKRDTAERRPCRGDLCPSHTIDKLIPSKQWPASPHIILVYEVTLLSQITTWEIQ